MAKPNEVVPDEALLLIETTWPAYITIPASKAALLNDIRLWNRKYISERARHEVSPVVGDEELPKVILIPSEQVTAARMLAAMQAKEEETK